uniref:4Fe-4S single cluster domain-containing protein n=1 Tax=Candidatus Kentrum sp. TUN TaxID=2126343 RepID=A0A450ZFV7_9GAMM|nr:MAG: 4Fe-4S single cluster domain-containing protein [Candidatus Kentron sp. TUN]
MKTHSDTDQVAIPLRPQTVAGKTTSKEDVVGLLRRFYLENSEVSYAEESVHGQYLPAFLSPYRDGSALRHDYPLFLVSLTDVPSSINASWSLMKWDPMVSLYENPGVIDSPEMDSYGEQNRLVDIGIFPLPGLFKNLMADFSTEANQKRLLEESLVRLEKHVIEIVDKGGETPMDASMVLSQAISALQNSLRLGEKQHEQLKADLGQLMERIPVGYFLPFSRRVPLYILAHVAKLRFRSQREKTLREVKQLTIGLTALLEVEKAKSIESIEPKMVLDSIGPSGSRFMDPLALSNLMDHSQGSQGMSPDRLQRVQETLQILEDDQIVGIESPHLTLVRNASTDGVCGLFGADFPPELSQEWDFHESSDPFATAMAVFNEQTVMLIQLARAMRIASLDLENAYDAAIHDPWFASFDWYALSEEESKLAPVVLVVDSASNVVRNRLMGLSRLLRADRPIQILLEVQPGVDPGAETEDIISVDSRMELGYLGISYRRAIVTQSSATRPLHLLESFSMALQRERPALHLLGVGYPAREDTEHEQLLSPWLIDSAAVESRAHPLFRYDPTVGGKWWVPLSLVDNPQPVSDWPVHSFQYRTEDGAVTEIKMTFGFVDYALLDSRWWRYFYPVPDTLDAKEIIHLDDYLDLEPEQMVNRLPFLWAVYDDQNTRRTKLRRLIVSRTLVLACLDRREFWRTLQALAGVHNHHVKAAVARVEAEAKGKADKQQALLVRKHHAELTKVRQEAGADALRRLADTLLITDFTSPGATGLASSTVDEILIEGQNEEHQETVHADIDSESDSELITEPWIDTPLCTSCNECIDLNQKLFVYNDDKQAEIGDLAAGTHAELVEAAEICPAKCIYPGII